MKILHLLSQRPDSTGSGFYVREIIRESHTSGHTNILIAGAPAHDIPDLSSVPVDSVDFLCFESPELPFPIPGMSDVMPYRSTRFREMSDDQLQQYSDGFSMTIQSVVRKHQPDLIHTNHLWLMTSLVRQLFPDIPVVTSSHGTDLRQMVNCPHLRDRIVPLCRG